MQELELIDQAALRKRKSCIVYQFDTCDRRADSPFAETLVGPHSHASADHGLAVANRFGHAGMTTLG